MQKYKLSSISYFSFGLAAAVFLHASFNNNIMTYPHWGLLIIAISLLIPDIVKHYAKTK